MAISVSSAVIALKTLSCARSSGADAALAVASVSIVQHESMQVAVAATTRVTSGGVVLDIYKAPAGSQGAGDYFLDLTASNGSSVGSVEISPGELQAALKAYRSGASGSSPVDAATLFPESAAMQDVANFMSSALEGDDYCDDGKLGASTMAVLQLLAGSVKSGTLAIGEHSVNETRSMTLSSGSR